MNAPASKSAGFQSSDLAPLTVEQYHRMLEEGPLQSGDPIELLDGLLVLKD